MDNDTGVYIEVQRIKFWWMWLIVIVMAVFGWGMFVCQIVLGIPVGNHPAPNFVVFIVTFFLGIFMPIIFLAMNLKIRVSYDGIYFRYFPFNIKEKHILFDEIDTCEMVEFNVILEYGGWGIHRNFEGVISYTVSGKKGVLIKKMDGKKIVLGSQRAEELVKAIIRMKSS